MSVVSNAIAGCVSGSPDGALDAMHAGGTPYNIRVVPAYISCSFYERLRMARNYVILRSYCSVGDTDLPAYMIAHPAFPAVLADVNDSAWHNDSALGRVVQWVSGARDPCALTTLWVLARDEECAAYGPYLAWRAKHGNAVHWTKACGDLFAFSQRGTTGSVLLAVRGMYEREITPNAPQRKTRFVTHRFKSWLLMTIVRAAYRLDSQTVPTDVAQSLGDWWRMNVRDRPFIERVRKTRWQRKYGRTMLAMLMTRQPGERVYTTPQLRNGLGTRPEECTLAEDDELLPANAALVAELHLDSDELAADAAHASERLWTNDPADEVDE
jgi:hypothetical protein